MIPFTLVMLNWARSENMAKIVPVYWEMPEAEVLIWNNAPTEFALPAHAPRSRVTVVNAPRNFGVLARYSMVLQAKTECVIIQDDDLLMSAETIRTLVEKWQQRPGNIHGLYGRNWKPDHTYAEFYDQDNRDVPIVLGRVMVFSRTLLADFVGWWFSASVQKLRAEYPGMPTHGDDVILSYVAHRQTGSLNTVYALPRVELNNQGAIHSHPSHFEYRQRLMQMLWCLPVK